MMRDMARRSLQPVGVVVEAQSFGGVVNSDSVKAGLISSNVPIFSIKKGDDLAWALGQRFETGRSITASH
jgi:hypothetical protein